MAGRRGNIIKINIADDQALMHGCMTFKEKYGDRFILTSSELMDDQICYFYFLILDRKVFEDGQKEIE